MTSLRIALRYLFSKKSHNAVNVISIISMLGVAVATMAIVCVLSVFNGFSDLAMSRMSLVDPEIKVLPLEGKVINNADSLSVVLSGLSEVEMALPTIEEQALAMSGHTQMAVTLRGVPGGYDKVTQMESTLLDGEYLTGNVDIPYATVSVGTAMQLGAHPSPFNMLKVYVPKRIGKINPANPMAAFRADSLLVGGVYQDQDSNKDANTMFAPLDMVRGLLEYTNEASAIELKGANGVDADVLKAVVEQRLGSGFRVMTRLEQEEQSFKMIAVEKWITFVMLAFILVIASFNVVSTLAMLIIEKRDNMSTLRALGATPMQIRSIYLWEGWLISALGGFVGIITGVILCLAQQWGGFIKLAADTSQLAITEYPVRVDVGDLAVIAALVALVGMIVGLVTSRFVPKQ